jgi:hypothetical protein
VSQCRRHGIVPARVKRGALKQPPCREPGTPEGSVCPHGLGGVMRARRMETAAARRAEQGRKKRGGGALVEPDQAHRGICSDALVRHARRYVVARHGVGARGDEAMRPQASAKARSSWAKGQLFTCERATSIMSQDDGSSPWCRRKISRSRRLARFRRMALPTAWVEATKQARRNAASGARGNHQTVKALQSRRTPCWRTSRMSLWRRRCCPGRRRMGAAIPGIKRRSAACDLSCGGRREPCGRRGSISWHEIRSCGLVSCGADER